MTVGSGRNAETLKGRKGTSTSNFEGTEGTGNLNAKARRPQRKAEGILKDGAWKDERGGVISGPGLAGLAAIMLDTLYGFV